MNIIDALKKNAQKESPSDMFNNLSLAEREEARLLALIANEIMRIRKRAGLTQCQFAAKIGVTQPMISQWESGEYNFSIEMLARIFQALNTHVDMRFQSESMAQSSDWKSGNVTKKGFIFNEAA